MGISIKVQHTGLYPILSVAGRIVSVDSEKFKKKMESFCDCQDQRLIVDISKTDFIDSFGLGTLVRHHTKLQKEGREMIILNENPKASGYLTRLFEMTRLDQIFMIVRSMSDL